jgi:hypothetical protein
MPSTRLTLLTLLTRLTRLLRRARPRQPRSRRPRSSRRPGGRRPAAARLRAGRPGPAGRCRLLRAYPAGHQPGGGAVGGLRKLTARSFDRQHADLLLELELTNPGPELRIASADYELLAEGRSFAIGRARLELTVSAGGKRGRLGCR